MNVATGPAEDKMLATGLHKVRDIYCKLCLTIVGWTYVSKNSASFSLKCEQMMNHDASKVLKTHDDRNSGHGTSLITDGDQIWNVIQ